jgi:hypothetical protein
MSKEIPFSSPTFTNNETNGKKMISDKGLKRFASDKKKMLRVITFLKEGIDAINDSFDSFTSTMKDFSNSLKRAHKDLKDVFDEENINFLTNSFETGNYKQKGIKTKAASTLAQLLTGQSKVQVTPSPQPIGAQINSGSQGAPILSSVPPSAGEPPKSGPPSRGGPPSAGGPPKSGPPSRGGPPSAGGPPKSGPPSRGGPPSAGSPVNSGSLGDIPQSMPPGKINSKHIRNEMQDALKSLRHVLKK